MARARASGAVSVTTPISTRPLAGNGSPTKNLVPNRPGEVGPALRHGCYSVVRLSERAQAIRAELEERLPLHSEADGPIVDLAALVLAQCERAAAVLSNAQARESQALLDGRRVDKGTERDLSRLSADLRGWTARAERLLGQLAMTPKARVGVGLQVVQTQSAVEALNAYLDARATRRE